MTERYELVLKIPTIEWSSVLSSLETGAALTLGIFGFSYLSLYILYKIVETDTDPQLIAIPLMLSVLSIPTLTLSYFLTEALDITWIGKDHYQDLKEKAEEYDEIYEVEN